MDYSSANHVLWEGLINSGIIASLILFSNLIRRKFKPIRSALIPSAVLAGFLGLFLKEVGVLALDESFLSMVSYHMLAIGFIALGLRIPRRKDILSKTGQGWYDSINSGMLIVANYLLQGAIGLTISIVLVYTINPQFFMAAGILLPMGFGQGPGQANNIGSVYQGAGFLGGTSYAVAMASFGFLWASIGGLVYLNYLKKKNRLPVNDVLKQHSLQELRDDENEVPLVEPIDRLSLQLSMVLVVYLITYLLIRTVLSLVPGDGSSGLQHTLSSLLWGFNFLIGSSLALLTRGLFKRFRSLGWMTHQYPNTYLLNRISGFAFDVMIVSSICTIKVVDLQGKWLPFILMTTAAGFATLFYNIYMGKKLYPDYSLEGSLAMYGMMTGTVSTGIMLLQQVDHGFRTPMSQNLITGSSTAILLAIPVLVLVGLAIQSALMTIITLGICILYFCILHFSLIYRSNQWKKKNSL